jgi:hypothetical protein
MKMPKHLEKLSTGAGLLVLGIGFASLGILSFINGPAEGAATGLFFDATYSVVGSLISILVGATFFTIAVLFAATLHRRNGTYRRRDALLRVRRRERRIGVSGVGVSA